MSHVNRGDLHAYLDGALDEYPIAEAERIRSHLDECAECADWLAKERVVHSDAVTMLGLATPEVDFPTLEELRAYVEATRPARPKASVRMYRMGWAASVVLAVGAGWMMRGGGLQQIQLERAGLPDVLGSAQEFSDAEPSQALGRDEAFQSDGRDVDPTASTLSSRADAETASPFSPPASSATPEVSEPSDASAVEFAGGRGNAPAPVMARALAAPGPEAVDEVETASAVETMLGETIADSDLASADLTAAGTFRETPERQDLPIEAVPDLSAREGLEESLPLAADATAAGSLVAMPASQVEEEKAEEERPARVRAEPGMTVTSAFDPGAGSGARRATSDEQLDIDDEPSLVVPGFEVLSVANIGEGTTPIAVHVIQGMDNGEELHLFHLQRGVDPGVVPGPADGRNEVRLEASGGWIVIQGRLTDEELRELLASLFPDEPA